MLEFGGGANFKPLFKIGDQIFLLQNVENLVFRNSMPTP